MPSVQVTVNVGRLAPRIDSPTVGVVVGTRASGGSITSDNTPSLITSVQDSIEKFGDGSITNAVRAAYTQTPMRIVGVSYDSTAPIGGSRNTAVSRALDSIKPFIADTASVGRVSVITAPNLTYDIGTRPVLAPTGTLADAMVQSSSWTGTSDGISVASGAGSLAQLRAAGSGATFTILGQTVSIDITSTSTADAIQNALQAALRGTLDSRLDSVTVAITAGTSVVIGGITLDTNAPLSSANDVVAKMNAIATDLECIAVASAAYDDAFYAIEWQKNNTFDRVLPVFPKASVPGIDDDFDLAPVVMGLMAGNDRNPQGIARSTANNQLSGVTGGDTKVPFSQETTSDLVRLTDAGILVLTNRVGWRTWGGRLGTNNILRWIGNRRIVDEFVFQANNRLIPFVSLPRNQEIMDDILTTVETVGRELVTDGILRNATAELDGTFNALPTSNDKVRVQATISLPNEVDQISVILNV